MRICRSMLLVIVAVALLSVVGQAAGDKKNFKSTKYSYRVDYPSSWHLLDQKLDQLFLVNCPPHKRVRGTVIPAGGASISVRGFSPGDFNPEHITSREQWIERDLQGNILVDRSTVPVPDSPLDGCGELTRVISKGDAGGKTNQVTTALYCLANGQPFRISETNWEDDPNQPQYQELALKIALSLRAEAKEQ
jgi:hypothetical protein